MTIMLNRIFLFHRKPRYFNTILTQIGSFGKPTFVKGLLTKQMLTKLLQLLRILTKVTATFRA